MKISPYVVKRNQKGVLRYALANEFLSSKISFTNLSTQRIYFPPHKLHSHLKSILYPDYKIQKTLVIPQAFH